LLRQHTSATGNWLERDGWRSRREICIRQLAKTLSPAGNMRFSSTVVESRNLPYAFMHNGSSRALLFTDTGQADENSRVHHPFGRKKVELSLPEFGEIQKIDLATYCIASNLNH
jgi:hypothetical protein